MHHEKILILGATGRTGHLFLQLALKAGFQVNVLVRNTEIFKINHSNLAVFQGTPTNKDSLKTAMKGCRAVVSALNVSRISDFPWAKLRSPENFLSETIMNVAGLCKDLDINRVIVLSAWGVGDTRKDIPGWFRWLIDHSTIRIAYQDHNRQEQILAASDLRYTIIRPAGLTNFKNAKNITVSLKNKPKTSLTISRKDVAQFILMVLEQGLYIRESPVISS